MPKNRKTNAHIQGKACAMHDLITKEFNPRLNHFIARYGGRQQAGRIETGGLQEVGIYYEHFFARLAFDLVQFRENAIKSSTEQTDFLDLNNVKPIFDKLFGVIEEAGSIRRITKKLRWELDDYFFIPLENFFKKLDGYYNTQYFMKRFERIPRYQETISDDAFLDSFIGSAAGAGVKLGKKELDELREERETIDEFLQNPRVYSPPELEKTYDVSLRLTRDGAPLQTAFEIKRRTEDGSYTVSAGETDESGIFNVRLLKGTHLLRLIGNTRVSNPEKIFSVDHDGKFHFKFSPVNTDSYEEAPDGILKQLWNYRDKLVRVLPIVIVVILAILIIVPLNFNPQIHNYEAAIYRIASEQPLKANIGVTYELTGNAKRIYLQNQEGVIIELACGSEGKCTVQTMVPIESFKLLAEEDSQYVYLIEKQEYLLCAEFETPLIPKQCRTLELNDFEFRSSNYDLLIKASAFGCPLDYKKKENVCIKIQRCVDGTEYGTCSITKPQYCEDGNLISRASICGCSTNEEAVCEECQSIFLKGPIEREFKYTLRGLPGKINFTLYSGLNNYLAGNVSSFYYCDPDCPTDLELELGYVDEVNQTKELDKLIEIIRSLDEDKDDQARIAISIVQQIPYDDFGGLTPKYPYSVLYENKGVCGDKSKLLVFILRGLGYSTALFTYEEEMHQAAGVECPSEYSLNDSGYCFIETSRPAIPTDFYGDYLGIGRLTSNPAIIEISDGDSFESIGNEYRDMLEFHRLYDLGRVLDMDDYHRWVNLVSKYGLEVDQTGRI